MLKLKNPENLTWPFLRHSVSRCNICQNKLSHFNSYMKDIMLKTNKIYDTILKDRI